MIPKIVLWWHYVTRASIGVRKKVLSFVTTFAVTCALFIPAPMANERPPLVKTIKGAVQSKAVTPSTFENDLRTLPKRRPWKKGDPTREVPKISRPSSQTSLPGKQIESPDQEQKTEPQTNLEEKRQGTRELKAFQPSSRQPQGNSGPGGDVHPSIRYAGRLSTDTPGTLPQGEATIIDGSFSQTVLDRWGDYSSMNVDPTDDCTFWYTNEYIPNSDGAWGTRIGAFSFPTCKDNDFTVPELNFEGISFTGAIPPDTVGDVGPNHYIQMANDGPGGSIFAIYDKAGNSVVGPTSLQSLWTAGGPCASGRGDPIVLFDNLAGRWLMSEFDSTRSHLCVYISQTSDPVSGGWFLYDFAGSEPLDYPKFAVWPDAYYVSSNESNPAVYALDRSQMLNGLPATFQRFEAPRLAGFGFQAHTPSDIDGSSPPPAGSPHYFIRHRDDEVHPEFITLTDSSATWQSTSIDISSALGFPEVVIRFAYDTVDAAFNGFEGFYVDDVVVSVDTSAVFNDDFESGASGWVGTGLWHLTTACSAPLPDHSTPTTFYYGQDTTCNYDTGAANSGTLTSPVLDLSAGGTAANLSFNYFLATEQLCNFDDARVQISTDGGDTFQDLIGNCVGLSVGVVDPTADFLEIWKFQVDFADSANSAFTGPFSIAISEFDSDLCGLTSFSCFPQPDTFWELDPLREVVMWRSQYRNFGSHEALVGNFVTDVDGTDHGGIRWYELRKTGAGDWTLFQEGTYAPDESHRWMGSIAMDKDGNIALGYSVSGAEILPDPYEANNNFAEATPITCPAFLSTDAVLDPPGDVDYFLLNGTPGSASQS